ncbi:MAG: type I restriction enzyme HsdR N-terminal domain-containing protein [Flavobacteriaceae bacterium]|nr:type I restriction enzyme HsdR N-terminal domain-containing protein [Flavobacteriaceae bacterium]
MQALNLPTYPFKIKSSENKYFIFDIVRKKYVILTPEEWVRQHIIHYLIEEKNYPISLIAVEKKVTVNKLTKRTDILVFNTKGNPHIIVECKAPSIKISQDAFDQIARYNLKLEANYLIVTNGLTHFYAIMDLEKECYVFLKEIPKYE